MGKERSALLQPLQNNEDLHRRVKEVSEKTGRSLSRVVLLLLEGGLKHFHEDEAFRLQELHTREGVE